MSLKRKPLRYAHSNGYTDVCFSKDGKYVLTCGRDGDIRIWLGVEDDDPKSICGGDIVQCILLDENRMYMVNDSLSLQILSYPEGKRIGILTKFTAQINHIAFDSSQKYLAAGGEDMKLQVISLIDNTVLQTFSDIEGPILSVAVSPGGKFVSASSGEGLLKIWSVKDIQLVKAYDCVPFVNNFNSATVYCKASFEPTIGRYFAYPNTLEVIVVDTTNWRKVFSLSESAAKGTFNIVAFSPNGNYLAASTTKGCFCVWHTMSQKLVGYSPHPNKNDICSFVWNPLDNGEIVYCDTTGELGAIEGCNLSLESDLEIKSSENLSETKKIPSNDLLRLQTDDDDDDDNENVFSLEKIKAGTTFGDIFSDEENAESRAPSRHTNIDGPIIITNRQLQPPFQSSSTPAHLSERYLLWNDIGIVRAFAADDNNPAFVDISFHDVNVHHLMHLRNTYNHSMAGLSAKIVALASESVLVCIILNENKEWKIEMSVDEEILSLTASETHVAVATDARMLRIFTIYGTQRDVVCLPGAVVTVASKNNVILVAYHNGPGINEDQNINIMILHIEGIHLKSTDLRLPLSPAATLAWLGFSTRGSLVAYDSAGLLRLFSSSSGVWYPIFNYSKIRKGVSDGLFIIKIDEEKEIIDAIACKGSYYPPITPKPIVSEYKFTVPLCESDTEKSRLEEIFIRSLHSPEQKTTAILESSIKLFSLGCQEIENRSFELAEMLSTIPKFLEIAWKYASRKNYINLADKITELMEKLEEQDDVSPKLVSDIYDNREKLLASLPTRTMKNTNSSEEILRPLPVKINSNKKIVNCKSPDRQQVESFEDNICSTSPLCPTPDLKGVRNPFSKCGKAPLKKNPNPFTISGDIEMNEQVFIDKKETPSFIGNNFNTTTKKRKEPETTNSQTIPTKKQSKLAQFEFQKN